MGGARARARRAAAAVQRLQARRAQRSRRRARPRAPLRAAARTFSPSFRKRKPVACTAVWCANTSGCEPSSGVMKPNPFFTLNPAAARGRQSAVRGSGRVSQREAACVWCCACRRSEEPRHQRRQRRSSDAHLTEPVAMVRASSARVGAAARVAAKESMAGGGAARVAVVAPGACVWMMRKIKNLRTFIEVNFFHRLLDHSSG